MSRIYKYPLQESGGAITLPQDAKFLSVQWQGKEPVLWFEVDITKIPCKRKVLVVFTGMDFDSRGYAYIGTLQMGAIVYHFYLEDEVF